MVKSSIFKYVQQNIEYITIYIYTKFRLCWNSIGKCNKQSQLILLRVYLI